MQSRCKQASHLKVSKEETYVEISLDYYFIAGIKYAVARSSLGELG